MRTNRNPNLLTVTLVAGFLVTGFGSTLAQENIKITLPNNKEHTIKFSGSAQFWARYTQLNPGSMVFKEEKNEMIDLSVRRYRIGLQGNASDNLRYVFVVGNNNLNYYTVDNINLHLLDAYVDYQITSFLGAGIGKNGWTGLSRYAAPSATQPLALDIDFVSIPLVNVYDDILRKLNVYVRGQVGGFDYRAVIAKPSYFNYNNGNKPNPNQARFADKYPVYQASTYVKYQFLEKETQASPWSAGTYMGKKNVLNIGGGMFYQPNTTWFTEGADTVYHPMKSWAIDLFFEKATWRKEAITFYVAYFNHNFGKNFVRNIGVNNPATGVQPSDYVAGAGNSAPFAGTGRFIYGQIGYLTPLDLNNTTQLQPYFSCQYGMLAAFDDPAVIYNTGFNYYLNGQKSKITCGYENRPVFKRAEELVKEDGRKGMVVMQYQMMF
jgi:hypothetical protein